jgi:LysM repeat protein
MKNNSGLQMKDDDSTYSPKRRRTGYGNSKFFSILLVALLILIFAGGILYFLSKRSTGGGASLLQLKVAALEEKVGGLEKQLTELQGKLNTSGTDSAPVFLQRLNALTQKVEAMEKQKQPTAGPKAKPSAISKPSVSTDKQYHTVQKGETLYQISKKYKRSVEELRKLNNLSADKPLRIGQKLLISTDKNK